MSTPAGRRQALEAVSSRGVSERAACRYLGLSRRVTGYELRQPVKDRALGERLIASSQELPRFGYRRTALWLKVSLCRVKRLWRRLGTAAAAQTAAAQALWDRYPASRGNAPQ
jgi:hypothetical protein